MGVEETAEEEEEKEEEEEEGGGELGRMEEVEDTRFVWEVLE